MTRLLLLLQRQQQRTFSTSSSSFLRYASRITTTTRSSSSYFVGGRMAHKAYASPPSRTTTTTTTTRSYTSATTTTLRILLSAAASWPGCSLVDAWTATTTNNSSLQQQQQPQQRPYSFVQKAASSRRHFLTATTTTTRMMASSSSNSDTRPNPFATKEDDENENNSDPLASIRVALDNTWIQQLSPETPENVALSYTRAGLDGRPSHENEKNQRKRPVLNGHYVLVRPTGLSQPRLVLTSPTVAHDLLGMTEAQIDSDDFVAWVSGNDVHNGSMGDSWATPYALSIMGTRYTHNCPFGDGTGYGDGRAIR